MNSVLSTEMWKHLPFETILHLAQSNHQLSRLFDDNNFWTFILARDFDTSSSNPKEEYLRYVKLLKFFTSIIPIITQPTLQLIYSQIPPDRWNQLKRELLEYQYPRTVFDVGLLMQIFETMIGNLEVESDQEEEYYEYRKDEGMDEEQEELIQMADRVEAALKKMYPNALDSTVSGPYRRYPRCPTTVDEKYYKMPAIIYVKGEKKHVNINLDYLYLALKDRYASCDIHMTEELLNEINFLR